MNSIVVMPDFFIDRIIKLNSKEDFIDALTEKAKLGGGSIRDMPTVDIKGGNAVNIAYCLAKLGAKVTLFTISDKIGAAVLRHIFSKFEDKVNLRIADGKHGLTTSFEFINEQGFKANVMLSDTGDNINFGPERVNSVDDLKILRNADGVVVVNWASNSSGTQLIEHVFKNSPKSLHFIDPADIETRRQEFLDSLTKIGDIIDILSINENECNSLAKAIGFDSLIPSNNYDSGDVKNAAAKLAGKVGVSIDLHTRIGAAWSNGRETAFAKAIKVEPKTLTGAGDSWDAADILGYLAGLDTKERLVFSNAYVSLYIRNSLAEPACIKDVLELLERIDM
ncbi:MAG: carbohydrate kinase family protein [Nitrososphaeraceae archaeon]